MSCNSDIPELPPDEPINLKAIIQRLGSRLVSERKFGPAIGQLPNAQDKNTEILSLFNEFLNTHEAAREVLAEMGFEWPLPERMRSRAVSTVAIGDLGG